jgi:phenylacetate-CoA ligase
MFIISGVNIFPSDIEYVVRNTEGVNGEYRIKLFEEDRLAKFVVEVEKIESSKVSSTEIAENISNSIKTRLGVKPKRVDILAENSLPRETHKAKRIVKLN